MLLNHEEKKMGTNYYLRLRFCSCCGRYDERHIGKSSAGWKFIFRVHENIDVNEWKGETLHYKNWSDEEGIFNEYGDKVSYDDFWELVKNKQDGKPHLTPLGEMHRAWIDENGYNVCNYDFS